MTDWNAEFKLGAEKLAKVENSNAAIYDKLKSGQQKQAQLVDRGIISMKGKNQVVIEHCSQDEIYLVDREFVRIKRICGGTVTNKEKTGDPCVNVAGLFTNHKNFGRCRIHEKQWKNNLFDRFIKAKQKSGDLISFYDAAKKIPDEEIENLYPQARLILAFQNMFRHSVEERIKEHKVLIEKRKIIWEGYTDAQKLEAQLEGPIKSDYHIVFDAGGNFIMELTTAWTTSEIAFFTILQEKYAKIVEKGYKMKSGYFLTPKAMDSMFDTLVGLVKESCGEERALHVMTLFVQNTLFTEGMVRDGTKELGDAELSKIKHDTKYYLGDGK